MDLQDRALLLNPDDVAALLEALELDHESHGIGNMWFCDRAVCRLAQSVLNDGGVVPANEVEHQVYEAADEAERVGYDEGYEEGYRIGYKEGCNDTKYDHAAAQ